MGDPVLKRSYAHCERVAKAKAANFYPAFRLLPRPQYLGMCALYAFLREADDRADEPAPVEEKRRKLEDFRRQLDGALAGDYRHDLCPAFADTVRRFGIPPEYPHAALDGVCMDLDPVRYETFQDLYGYCYRVASVVGLSCVHVWGSRGDKATGYAEKAGIAFQLTNILRDVGEDAAGGRVYLPREDLARFGYAEDELRRGVRDDRFVSLMEFQAERARDYYEAAGPLAGLLAPPGRAVFLVMSRTYRSLLERVVACRYDVFGRRVRVPRWYKLWQVVRALPVRFGMTAG